jgi:hypothetical protein
MEQGSPLDHSKKTDELPLIRSTKVDSLSKATIKGTKKETSQNAVCLFLFFSPGNDFGFKWLMSALVRMKENIGRIENVFFSRYSIIKRIELSKDEFESGELVEALSNSYSRNIQISKSIGQVRTLYSTFLNFPEMISLNRN